MALPLDGIRVLDNGIVQAGTFPSRLLADFGAEVVRVENYVRPDLSRHVAYANGAPGDPYWEAGGNYHEQHRNKRFCVGLDVRRPEGREAFLRLVQTCDVVLDSHPPGVMDKLDLDYRALKQARPDVIYVSTSGYGYGGPYSTARSYGMMTEIMCGIGWLNGYAGEEARRGNCPLTDHPSTYHGAFIVMAALIRRRRTGKGIWIDMSQYEISVNVIGDAHVANAIGAPLPARSDHDDPGSLFSGVFRCAGFERWIAVSATSPESFRGLYCAVGRKDLAALVESGQPIDDTVRESLAASVAAWCEERDDAEAFAVLSSAGVATSPVNDVRDLLLDPHLRERGYFVLVEHAPEQHAGTRAWPGPPAWLSATPVEIRFRAPMLGEHNRLVATTLLGYTGGEYESLEALGAFGSVPAAAGFKPPAADVPARVQLPPGSYGRSKLYDPEFIDRLRERFGPAYGDQGCSHVS
jgi:crotonobetainyl-CoA:carnitine CoA-transferase CaiB-like acyl-CoA transferase